MGWASRRGRSGSVHDLRKKASRRLHQARQKSLWTAPGVKSKTASPTPEEQGKGSTWKPGATLHSCPRPAKKNSHLAVAMQVGRAAATNGRQELRRRSS